MILRLDKDDVVVALMEPEKRGLVFSTAVLMPQEQFCHTCEISSREFMPIQFCGGSCSRHDIIALCEHYVCHRWLVGVVRPDDGTNETFVLPLTFEEIRFC